METDKINVFIPRKTAEILEKDAQSFEIFKAGSTALNMNRFLSRILVGYYDVYTSTYNNPITITLWVKYYGLVKTSEPDKDYVNRFPSTSGINCPMLIQLSII